MPQLHENVRAIAGISLAPASAAMIEIHEDGKRLLDDLVRRKTEAQTRKLESGKERRSGEQRKNWRFHVEPSNQKPNSFEQRRRRRRQLASGGKQRRNSEGKLRQQKQLIGDARLALATGIAAAAAAGEPLWRILAAALAAGVVAFWRRQR